mmetsp:Transcript_6885/g.21499  ORF Transcript_6885/g.21499 Transcript_6885/m.21499 type:complete len:253 (+) Transcript_6885:302-1060(+)
MGGGNGGAHPAACEPGMLLPGLRQDSMGAAGAEAARVAASVAVGTAAGADEKAAVGAAAGEAMGTEAAAMAGADATGADAAAATATALASAAVAVCGTAACRTAMAGGCKFVPAGTAETHAGIPTTPTMPSGCEYPSHAGAEVPGCGAGVCTGCGGDTCCGRASWPPKDAVGATWLGGKAAPRGGDQPGVDGADSHPQSATHRTCAAYRWPGGPLGRSPPTRSSTTEPRVAMGADRMKRSTHVEPASRSSTT